MDKTVIKISVLGVLFSQLALAEQSPTLKCQIEIENYVHVSSWSQSRNGVRIEAKRACSSHKTQPLEFKDASFTITLANKKKVKIIAPQASFLPGFNAFHIGKGSKVIGERFVSDPSLLVIDTKTGEMRTSQGFYFDLSQKHSNIVSSLKRR